MIKFDDESYPGMKVPNSDALETITIARWNYDIDADRIQCGSDWYKLMGLPADQKVASIADFHRCIHPDDLGAATEFDADALADMTEAGGRYDTAFRIVRPNGEIRHLRSTARLYRDPASGHRCAAGLVIDVTVDEALPSIRVDPSNLQSGLDEAFNVVLSDSERQCLAWAAQGKTAWETARIMVLSHRTVEFHLARAIDKLKATNKVQAAALAARRGLI